MSWLKTLSDAFTITPAAEPIQLTSEPAQVDNAETKVDMVDILRQALATTQAEPKQMPSLVWPEMPKRRDPEQHAHQPHDEPTPGTTISISLGGAIRTDHN